ncbi:MAG: hypothetical protein QG650_406 [Patescibacteria group bacterium]|nr:hypothetical protein [Patescibacteria group bacterium]
MSNKGSTSIVGYIAMLMIAGAALGHGEPSFSSSALQTNAIAFRDTDPSYFLPQESRRVRISIEGKTYDAFLLDEDVVSDKIRMSY